MRLKRRSTVTGQTTIRFCTLFLLLLGCLEAMAQSGQKPVQREEVNGFMEVLGYLGGKLGDELGSRLNPSDAQKKESGEEVPTLIKVSWSPFKVERTKMRPKKK